MEAGEKKSNSSMDDDPYEKIVRGSLKILEKQKVRNKMYSSFIGFSLSLVVVGVGVYNGNQFTAAVDWNWKEGRGLK